MPNRARSTINLLAAAMLGLSSAALPAVAFAQSASEGASSAPVTSGTQVTVTGSPAPVAEGQTVGSAPVNQAPPITQVQPATQAASPEATPVSVDGASTDGAANPVLPHDLSPIGMFMAADLVVKSVMVGLALASVATWAIFLVKALELLGAKARLTRAVRLLSAANGLADVKNAFDGKSGPAPEMVAAAIDEMVRSEAVVDHAPASGIKERVSSLLTRIEVRAGKRMTGGTGILASIGSVGPFVGLFGTVWGIMNSFIGISKAQTTNLAIVAPGIAEALLATAIGLVAAIPAVIIYNYFARAVGGYKVVLADAAAAVERLVSRDLDHRLVRKAQPRRQEGFVHAETTIARIG
ncbi:tonB-system energizer ExbB [Ensifer adhaerens]|uniref:tonB-system energizer ExbB n=1 Tax=Ensifer adhaerens TaxID=106592 RepID=UPI001CBDCF6C|nr:tonB-system energizer ExbB [Ensifer adhaerens]MBZ7921423.1 tonB-system energizer ExbB [Ensifer adhaerens]UAX93849.1 tonB-system energizer ExbB [Ensifer adhaerens]UAY01485.1 tonB-system energizer ExbB [Ensifer adhaerens]UAY08868.1 tonB-system energizer ExbB [Ensifer adhaerens]